jgi:hypothetical protein
MNHAEMVAKCVLEDILPCTMNYKFEQSHGECDYELCYHSGAIAAVEVTEAHSAKDTQRLSARTGCS